MADDHPQRFGPVHHIPPPAGYGVMAANTKVPSVSQSNGVITAPPKGPSGGNRKKQKRRVKQAVKPVGSNSLPPDADMATEDVDYDESALGYGEEEDDYSDTEQDRYDDHMSAQHVHPTSNGSHTEAGAKKKKKKKKNSAAADQLHPNMLPPLSQPGGRSGPRTGHQNVNIWNTTTQQERQNIKDFWLGLSEEERKGLLKIEKEAVLKKMKQQQKHSCSCTVCGRKRTAIEEELEVLYEGYYEELEQYTHHDQPPLPSTDGMIPDPLQHRRPHPLATPPPPNHHSHHHHQKQLQRHPDDGGYSNDDDDEYSDTGDDDDDDYSEEEPEPETQRPRGVPDFFSFGEQLTVKGILTPWMEKLKDELKGTADNLLTVADDLLKNDGRKFIEMMEQLAERRMQRENRSQYDADAHQAYPPDEAAYAAHEDSLAAGEEFDDDEASYDSQDEYDDDMDEEEDMVGDIELASLHKHHVKLMALQAGLTAEQRMQEGRRMFQIFAARMFEQRVLNAYREKVSRERQQKLLQEIDDEDRQQAQKELKKQRDAQKKKDKKKQQQQAKAEEKARKDAERAAEEARLKEEEEKKQEEQRRRKEEQRKKREEEKRRQDEERARKEADKLRRQQEEQQRREEAERKAREQKAKKDEARKREREEREAREKELRDRKSMEEKEKREREAKMKEREKPIPPPPPQIQKRPSQAGMVAIPGMHSKQTTSNISSPHPSIATPAIPKAPAPAVKQRQASQQSSTVVSPKQSQPQLSSSKSTSPGSTAAAPPKSVLPRPASQQPGIHHQPQPQPPLHQMPMQAPPGMHQPHQSPFGISPMGFPGFPTPQGPMIGNPMAPRGGMPLYHPQNLPMGGPNRMPFNPGMGGMVPPPPPGMMPPHNGRGMFLFDSPMGGQHPPPGFGQPSPHLPNQTSPIGQQPGSDAAQRASLPTHSRQASTSDKERFESAANQPIARPTPIQRPSSVKPDRKGSASDVDDLSKHLGSSALLDDSDEPIAPHIHDNRRHSGMSSAASARNMPGGFGAPIGGFGMPTGGWNMSPMPYGQSPGLGQPTGWGSLPGSGMSTWSTSPNPNMGASFHNAAAFGSLAGGGGGPQIHHRASGNSLNRPLALRIALCQACKHLTSNSPPTSDGFHPIEILLRQIEHPSSPFQSYFPNAPPSLTEIEAICETEGDAQNGGGELLLRKHPSGQSSSAFEVKWESAAGTPDLSRGPGPGEIGSPMPSRVSPANIGFGAASAQNVGVPGGGGGVKPRGSVVGAAGFQGL